MKAQLLTSKPLPAYLTTQKPSLLRLLTWLGGLLALPGAAYGQRLEAAGVSASLNITQTLASPAIIPMGYYTLDTTTDHSKLDEVGYRFAAYGRWALGSSRFFGQPEIAYTSTRGQQYSIAYLPVPATLGYNGDGFAHYIYRWEAAALVGAHTGRHTYILLGPVLAFNRREAALTVRAPESVPAVYNSLYASVEPVQVLAQAGIGVMVGRFDFNLRFEQSLTPYTQRFTYNGNSYGYKQRIRQGLLTAGILLYKPKVAPAY